MLARSLVKLQELDQFYDVHGFVREDGSTQESAQTYLQRLNSSRLTAAKLAEHMARRGSPGADLRGYIEANYSRPDE